jgi:hypothetical protein
MTRQRWVIFVIVLLAVSALGFWVSRHLEFESTEVPGSPKGEAATNPFYTAQRFAEALGAKTSWEHALGNASPDAVVYVSAFHWSLIPSRRQAIEQWVEGGGRLVVDNDLLGNEEFARWSGITREFPKRSERPADDDQDEQPDLTRSFDSCHEIHEGKTYYNLCEFVAKSWFSSTRAPIWALRDTNGMQAVRVRIGQGTVTALNAAPFSTTSFLKGDHPRLFSALTQLRLQDEVHFLSENESPSLLALTWREGAPVVVLFSVWLALTLWRGGVRFGPLAPRAELVRRSLAEQIRGTAHFALRIGDNDALHTATLRALSRAAQRRIPGYLALDTDARVAAIARFTSVAAEPLAAAMTAVDLRRVHNLRSAVALLETARRDLLQRSTRPSHGTQ